jgi:hypothetical protein
VDTPPDLRPAPDPQRYFFDLSGEYLVACLPLTSPVISSPAVLAAACSSAYIVLWIVLPEAVTASEKLEMRGEKIDLESIKEHRQKRNGNL